MSKEKFPYWRRVWQITSGNLKSVSREEVKSSLFDEKENILRGILQFKKCQSEKEAELTDKRAKDISYFISRTAEHLNVSTITAWQVLKSYIVNEYCGTIKTIQKMKYEMQILPMLNNCWRFYTSERMFLIKTLRNIIEFMGNSEHPLCEIYKEYVQQVSPERIWKALEDELEYLINEIKSDVAGKVSAIVQKNWIQRNMREIIEVTHCLIMMARNTNIQLSNFKSIVTLCKKHGFGNEPLYFRSLELAEPHVLNKLRYSEIALLLCIGNQLWMKKDAEIDLTGSNLYTELMAMAYRQEHGATCFIWAILLLNSKNDFDESIFHKYMNRAVSLDCYQFFRDTVSSEMFFDDKCLVGALTHIAAYNMFSLCFENIEMCNKYLRFAQIADIMIFLLKNRYICHQFFKENKFQPLWLTAVERYPLEKNILAKLAEAIIISEAPEGKQVIDQLDNLQWYTEIYDPSKVYHTQRHNNSDSYTVKLLSDRTIIKVEYTLVIPANSEAVITKEYGITYIHYKRDINFWLIYLTEIKGMIAEIGSTEYNESVFLGLKVLLAIIKTRTWVLKENQLYIEIIHSVFKLLDTYSCYPENKPMEVLAVCMDVCSELLDKCRIFVCSQMETYHLLPKLAKIDFTYEEIFHINFLEPGKLGNMIVRSEREQHHDLFLISFVNFLRTSFLADEGSFDNIELPGLVFILKEIFPHFMIWYAKRDKSYLDVLYQIIHFLFEMFLYASDKLHPNQYTKTRKIVYQCFLNESCGRTLLRILSVGNVGVQNIMEGQTNWRSGRGIKYISVIQKVMSILIQLLTQRKTVIGDNGLTPLELMIYTESDGVHSVQAIASFLNHSFNEVIPNLACRLLKKCTVELQMSMLAALDLSPDQVRMMFIHRLRDHLESEEMKLAIIELISASVPKQPGMTEAFFKVTDNAIGSGSAANGSASQSSVRSGVSAASSTTSINSFNEGIGTFLVEYLCAFSSENTTISSPLLSRIMELLHVLWMHQKEILIADIVKDEHFWPSLCSPLFIDANMSDKTYSEIFNIIGKEIHKRCGQIDQPLLEVLTKFFNTPPFLTRWLKYIISYEDRKVRHEVEYNMPPTDCLMLSFKDFLIIAIKFLPANFFSSEVQIIITEACRHHLKDHIYNINASCLITFLTELYLFLMKYWNESCFKNGLDCYNDILCIVQKISACYRDLEPRFVEALLTVTVLSLRGLKSVAISNPPVTKMFIDAMGNVFNSEYEIFLEKYHNKQVDAIVSKYAEQKAFIMCFESLNELMIILNATPGSDYNYNLAHSQMLHKLIDCVRKFVEYKSTLALAKLSIEVLINYAQSCNSNDFLSSDIDVYLWEKLQPPVMLRNPKYIDFLHIENLPWELKEWWILYRRIIMLLLLLLKKHGHIFIQQTLMFISLHEDYFCDILLLERYTVEAVALDLIKCTLMFLYELFQYQTYWSMDHEQSMINLLEAVKMSLNYSSAVLVRPSVLKYYSAHGPSEDAMTPDSLPSELLIEIMNKLTDIIGLATNCIMKFSPPVYKLLRDNRDYSSWPLQVGSSFGLPTFGDNDSCELTFGLLFCVASVYVRILQQSSSKKSNQATSPREILIARKTRFSKPDEPKDKQSTPTSKSAEEKETTPTSEKESHFCFSQIKRLASKQTVQSPTSFIRIDYLNPTYIVSAVENFGSYTSAIKTFPWYGKLSEEKVMRALECVISLIAAQVSHMLYPTSQLAHDARLIKRELSSELQSFHEFVKRRLSETQRYVSADRSLFRKKFGIVDHGNRVFLDDSIFHRVPVKRTLYTIQEESSQTNLTEKTTGPTTPCYSPGNGLFEVKLINDDYLHLLSVWFSYFLHYE